MCFSATASFISSATLLSASAYILQKAKPLKYTSIVSAAIPFAFSIQQALEGIVWMALNSHAQQLANSAAIGYIFFAYFLWPIYTPIFGLVNESIKIRKYVFIALTILGLIFGLCMFLPFVMRYAELNPVIVGNSISYFPGDSHTYIPYYMHFILYLAICPISLLISSNRYIRGMSLIIMLAFIISYTFFYYTILSTWCFFSAVISLYLIRIEVRRRKAEKEHLRPN